MGVEESDSEGVTEEEEEEEEMSSSIDRAASRVFDLDLPLPFTSETGTVKEEVDGVGIVRGTAVVSSSFAFPFGFFRFCLPEFVVEVFPVCDASGMASIGCRLRLLRRRVGPASAV